MPFIDSKALAGQKRKRPITSVDSNPPKSSKKLATAEPLDAEVEILRLEEAIASSRKNYNEIVKLHSIAKRKADEGVSLLASVALCRVFCRLRISGSLKHSSKSAEAEQTITSWLTARYRDYITLLLDHIVGGSEEVQASAVSLYMRLVKEEVKEDPKAWTTGSFEDICKALLASGDEEAEASGSVFIEDYVLKFDDVRFHLLGFVPGLLRDFEADEEIDVASNILELLMLLDPPAEGISPSLRSFFGPEPPEEKLSSKSPSAQRKRTSQAWLTLLSQPLTNSQKKEVLLNLIPKILPWFPTKPERLMDFLTDAYNSGGTISLLALSGVFHLMQAKNLDYPDFYQKLYSLLDDDILHSKHRSRFFRHLDTFMASTHLPAALVASFVKRLARLALHAPPAAIVATVPWIYNMLKMHPQCSFLIHRLPISEAEEQDWTEHGFGDPFDMGEVDPMLTGAIDSSIWEIETLKSHYHANVATLAKIIGEQFTKQAYNMEDFLDHSYNSLLEQELVKDLKKTPVVEYQIPKRIVTGEDGGLNPLGHLLSQALVSQHR